ncbi:GNAT family N-acetyltransferase [Neobacillus sp. MM2021_6]|uniref:GNAT family N-acetyltransferase n=1 Tax=Bacillaceae TaxID=186817 RepID=UPI00140858C1|nr:MULTISPECIES: GNAT family N-acetyltransferase [Bacillaceae]MBO0961141.1 GNAT family N-acetyltransferase [Neobacillus sp. MM2021_6]NHC19348.1 GNAT family N-acetyltransferase [Bacillus sp. MM2020_4]
MIKEIDLHKCDLVKELFELQKASYLVEAKLINFFDIPPLKETMEELKGCGELFLGYFEDTKLVGALSYTIEGEELTICRMVVDPTHFRKGIAQRLLEEVEKKNKDLNVIKVSTGKDNPPAKKLYLKNGYRLVGDIEVVPGLFISNFKKTPSKK